MEKLINFFKNEEGATAVEYGIMVALIAVAIIITVRSIGQQINSVFSNVEAKLSGAIN